MGRPYYRTVKNNQIKLLGRVLGCEHLKNGELDGKRFAFHPYFGRWGEDGFRKEDNNGLTALWGSEEYSLAVNRSRFSNMTEDEWDAFIKPYDDDDKEVLAPDGYLRWYFWKDIKVLPEGIIVKEVG